MGSATQYRGDLCLGAATVQRPEAKASDSRQPEHVGQPAVQGMPVGQHVVAGHQHEAERPVGGPCDEVEQDIERAPVGPLQVVDNQEDRSGPR